MPIKITVKKYVYRYIHTHLKPHWNAISHVDQRFKKKGNKAHWPEWENGHPFTLLLRMWIDTFFAESNLALTIEINAYVFWLSNFTSRNLPKSIFLHEKWCK